MSLSGASFQPGQENLSIENAQSKCRQHLGHFWNEMSFRRKFEVEEKNLDKLRGCCYGLRAFLRG
jgi:hypothetical protein